LRNITGQYCIEERCERRERIHLIGACKYSESDFGVRDQLCGAMGAHWDRIFFDIFQDKLNAGFNTRGACIRWSP
jgi:hypothetical protein